MNWYKSIHVAGVAIALILGSFKGVKSQDLDIVFTMDLSGSTNGLIDDLRDNVYDIVNYTSSLRPEPRLRIGMVGFARPSFGKKNYYISELSDLTSNFDELQKKLYELKPFVEKGDQFVGNAIVETVRQIQWSEANSAIKIIFLVGNGMVNTGSEDYFEACQYAKAKGIVIVPVYCDKSGNKLKEISGWKHIAEMNETDLFEIKIHKRIPMNFVSDVEYEKLHMLNYDFNNTYVWYGIHGNECNSRLSDLDRLAGSSGRSVVESRIFYKLSDYFIAKNKDSDLVDFIMSSRKSLEDIPTEALNDTLQSLSSDALYSFVLTMKEKRLRTTREIRKILPYSRQNELNLYYTENERELRTMLFGSVLLTLKRVLPLEIK